MQCNTMQCNTAQHSTAQHNTTQHNTIQYSTIQCIRTKKSLTQCIPCWCIMFRICRIQDMNPWFDFISVNECQNELHQCSQVLILTNLTLTCSAKNPFLCSY